MSADTIPFPPSFPLVFEGTELTKQQKDGRLGVLHGERGKVNFVLDRSLGAGLSWPIVRTGTLFNVGTPSETYMPFIPRTRIEGSFALTAALGPEKRGHRHTDQEYEDAGFAGKFSLCLIRTRLLDGTTFGEPTHDAILTTLFTLEKWATLMAWLDHYLPQT